MPLTVEKCSELLEVALKDDRLSLLWEGIRNPPSQPVPSNSSYRYLNSGLWAGYASHAAALLEAVVRQVESSKAGMKTNDQELVSDM